MLDFALALVKTRLDFFRGGTEGDGTLGTQGTVSISILPHCSLPLQCFPRDPGDEPNFHWHHEVLGKTPDQPKGPLAGSQWA